MGEILAVYGAERSGTTLFRLMLDGHSKISCPAETDFLFDHLRFDGADATPSYDVETMDLDRMFRAVDIGYPAGKDYPEATFDMIGQLKDEKRA